MTIKQLTSAALQLPTREREVLALVLLDSLEEANGLDEQEWSRTWAEEARHRLGRLRSGETSLVDADDLLTELDALVD